VYKRQGQSTFVDDEGYLQTIELIDNSGDATPHIICRNAVSYVTIYEDYAQLQHPERQWISIDQEKWHLYAYVTDHWQLLTPLNRTLSYETIDGGFILKRTTGYVGATMDVMYKFLEGNFVEQGIYISNDTPSEGRIRFALTLDIPAPSFSINDGNEITPTDTETEDDINIDIDNFRVTVSNVLHTWIDISRIKQHIWKWTHQRIDVDTIRIGVVTNEFIIPSGNNLEYWF